MFPWDSAVPVRRTWKYTSTTIGAATASEMLNEDASSAQMLLFDWMSSCDGSSVPHFRAVVKAAMANRARTEKRMVTENQSGRLEYSKCRRVEDCSFRNEDGETKLGVRERAFISISSVFPQVVHCDTLRLVRLSRDGVSQLPIS